MSVDAIAGKWHDQLLRNDPVDRASAEASVALVYRLAGMAEPEYFLWCESPLEAVWAKLVLVGKTESYNHAVYENFERSKSGKAKLAQARARVAVRLDIDEDEVEGRFGAPFYVAEGTNPVTKQLRGEITDAWLARAEAGDEYLGQFKGPFGALDRLEESLHHEGYKMRGGELRPALLRDAMLKSDGKHVEILGGRSAQHRLYGNLAYGEVARDEALAEAGKFVPTELQRAVWAAYEACFMWWPCHGGIILSERPVLVETSGESIAMQWADGFAVGAVSAHRAASAAVTDPVPASEDSADVPTQTGAERDEAPILSRPIPRDAAERVKLLSRAGPLPRFGRYLAGEHELVWKELVALGEAVRTEAHAADALAVAYETMDRVARNVRLLAERLEQMDYRFVAPGESGGLFGLLKPKAHRAHVPPEADIATQIAELEAGCGGPIPLSLRAFFEVVGEVNLLGRHPSIAPGQSDVAPDPLLVEGAESAIQSIHAWDEDECLIAIAPDALHKANVSGGDPYSISAPAPVADAPLDGEPHGVTFVEYLRIAMRWGGFPGWEGAASAPPELERLREGLVAF